MGRRRRGTACELAAAAEERGPVAAQLLPEEGQRLVRQPGEPKRLPPERAVLADSLRDLPCRLNGIFGDKDTTLYPDLSGICDYVEEIHPGAPVHVIPNAGHWVQFEAWEAVNKLLPDVLN